MSVRQLRFSELIQTALHAFGFRDVFGIPGVHNLELFREPERHGLSITVPRHEQGAGFMADGYFRVTGRPAVCALITGPGVLNALTPIAQAWHDSIPMLVLASTLEEAELGRHEGDLHDTPDVTETLRPYTCVSLTARTADEFLDALTRIADSWATERRRPAYIDIPRDLLREFVQVDSAILSSLPGMSRPQSAYGTGGAPETLDTMATAREIAGAHAPMIIAGGGVVNDGAALLEFAEWIDAPIALTGNAKAAVPAEHPLNLGVTIGTSATKTLLETSDLVIAVGTELSQVEYLNTGATPARMKRVIRVDIDPETILRSQPGSALATCANWFAAVTSALRASGNDILAGSTTKKRDGRACVATAREEFSHARAQDPFAGWIDVLERVSPPGTVFTLDSAQLAYQSHQHLAIAEMQRWLAPYGLGTLGPALPMAVGAAIAAPESPVIALAGDGGCLFTISELATARDLGRQLTLVIWDNAGYMEIENSFRAQGIAPVGVETSAESITAIARGFGAHAEEVRTPEEFAESLTEALLRPELSVIRILAPAEMHVGKAPETPVHRLEEHRC